MLGFSRPDYFASLVVTAQSGINSVRDLRGKTVALGPIGSTSKHLAPMQILKDNGLIPGVDVKLTHTSIEIGWEALKRGDVAAFGTTNDKFLKLRDSEKTLEPGAFKVIARGPDLPNDILLARPDIDSAILNRISSALLRDSEAFANTILKGEDNQKYRGMTFIEHIKDSDYDYVRQMYVTAGYRKLTQFVGN